MAIVTKKNLRRKRRGPSKWMRNIQKNMSTPFRQINFSQIKSDEQILLWMRHFNPKELLNWIQAVAIHPQNVLFLERFEYLVGLILSIPPSEFEGEKVTRSATATFFKGYDIYSSKIFASVEDWVPFNQSQRIPYFFRGHRYWFFYGKLERPHELLQQFEKMYLPPGNKPIEAIRIEQEFVWSLLFQTQLLDSIYPRGVEDEKEPDKKIFFPSDEFFSIVLPLFEVKKPKVRDSLPSYKLGEIRLASQLLQEKVIAGDLFDRLLIDLGSQGNYYILPQDHLDILYKHAALVIPLCMKNYEEYFLNRIRIMLNCNFKRGEEIIGIKLSGENSANPWDIGILYDSRLLLIKTVPHVINNNNINTAISRSREELELFTKKMLATKSVEITTRSGSTSIDPKDFTLWRFLLYESLEISPYEILPPPSLDTPSETRREFSMMDFQAILSHLEAEQELFSFLDYESRVENQIRLVTSDYIDRLAVYIQNNGSYTQSGYRMNVMIIEPHAWHHFYHQKIYEKYTSDDIHSRLFQQELFTFDVVEHLGGNQYEVMNKFTEQAGLVVKFRSKLVFITYPIRSTLSQEERESTIFVGKLIAYWIDIRKELLEKLWQGQNCEATLVMEVNLCDSSNGSVPIICHDIWDARNTILRILVEIAPELLMELFTKYSDNTAERLCVKLVVETIFRAFNLKLIDEEVVPLGPKKFASQKIVSPIPVLPDYANSLDFIKGDISRVQQKIASFLRDRGVAIGQYSIEQSKEFNNAIYQFLYDSFLIELRIYNESLLEFAYNQVELVEGYRMQVRAQIGMDASIAVDYDIQEQTKDKMQKIADQAEAAKFIVECILYHKIKGTNSFPQSEWGYIQAISLELIRTAYRSDNLHYQVIPITLEVDGSYIVKDTVQGEIFNQAQFIEEESSETIRNNKGIFQIMANPPKEHSSTDPPEILDKAFLEYYHFSLKNMLQILSILSGFSLNKNPSKPVFKLNRNDLLEIILNDKSTPVSRDTVEQAISYLTLEYPYCTETRLLFTKLLRQKERLNLCPLICISQDQFLMGNAMCLTSALLWRSDTSEGEFPYQIPDSNPISQAINAIHHSLDMELERRVIEVANQTLGAGYVEGNITNFKRLSQDFPSRPECGEIDTLAVNPTKKTIYVLDAKNRRRRLRPADIRAEWRTFFEGEKAYYTQLHKKTEFVEQNLSKVLQHFGVSNSREWVIFEAFIVIQNFPAAFARDYHVAFINIRDLPALLRKE